MGAITEPRELSKAVLIALAVLVFSIGSAHAADMSGVVDTLLGKYQNAGQTWTGALKGGATALFWILATISLSWTCISMALKRAEMGELFAELCRFILFTGFFFWLLTNGPEFASKIIHSLWQLGGEASGSGNSIYPAQLINLGLQVFQNQMKHLNFLLPAVTGIPALIAVIVLIVCALIAVNMILLLCAAWVVIYAGIIFLGFGGCRWTSDMAINYYRTVLGVGVSLMTMQLTIGLGIKFLQDLVASTGDNPDVGQLAIVMVACIILAVIAHRLPQMVAGMVVGGGHNGAVGGIGVLTLLGAGMAGASIIRSVGAGAGTAAITEGAAASARLLEERIAAAEAAIAAGGGSSSGLGGSIRPGYASSSTSGGVAGAVAQSAGIRNFAVGKSDGGPAGTSRVAASNLEATGVTEFPGAGLSVPTEPAESPQARPMTPDEARGFPPEDPNAPIDWEEERRRYVNGEDRAI